MVLAAAVAAVAVGGGIAWASTRTSGPVYRVATAVRGDVSQTVNGVGSMSSVTQRTLTFGSSGTVKSVDVAVGSEVSAGQVVAQLDTTSLEQQVRSDQSAVATAQQQLSADESAQASADSTDSLAATPIGSSSTPPRSGGSGGTGAGSTGKVTAATLQADQRAVVAAQAKVDGLLDGPAGPRNPHVLSVDLAALHSACAASTVTFTAISGSDGTLSGTVLGGAGLPVSLVGGTYADGSPVAPSVVAADGSYTFGSSSQQLRATASYTVQLGDATTGVVGSGACGTALSTVADDENAVARAERDLAQAERTLDADLAAYRAASSGRTPTGGSSSSNNGSSNNGTSSGNGSSGNGSSLGNGQSSSTTITAAQLAADQKQIDAANARLALSQQNLSAATLRSPIDGTVGAISMTAGSVASSTNSITVIGHGRKAVSVEVGIGVIDKVHVGQRATVTIDGVTAKLTGKVSEVGVLICSGTSGSSTTYPVTVLLAPTSLPIYDGAGASVSIDVGAVHDVVTVPVSAIHRTAFGATVDRLVSGKPVSTRVTLGATGVDTVEIKTGLSAGQRVVLAEVSAPVPTDSLLTNRRGGLGGGGLTFGTGGGGARRFVGGG